MTLPFLKYKSRRDNIIIESLIQKVIKPRRGDINVLVNHTIQKDISRHIPLQIFLEIAGIPV